MWYFPRIDDICQSILHWEENHYIYIILFWGTHILLSLTVPLYYLTVNFHRKCQHSKPASIFGNNLCKVSLCQNILISLFQCTKWLLSRKKKWNWRRFSVLLWKVTVVLEKHENSIFWKKFSGKSGNLFWSLQTSHHCSFKYISFKWQEPPQLKRKSISHLDLLSI